MKTSPILFSGPMVCAMLEGRKTQTRRIATDDDSTTRIYWVDVVETTPHGRYTGWVKECGAPLAIPLDCRYGRPGDLLWVRETCHAHELSSQEAEKYAKTWDTDQVLYGLDGVVFHADNAFNPIKNSEAASEAWCRLNDYRQRQGATVPGIHMPRWASRLTLRVEDIRVERLKDISEADARDEGAGISLHEYPHWDGNPDCYRKLFRERWKAIHGQEGWAKNPWVWALTFEVIKANVDDVLKKAA